MKYPAEQTLGYRTVNQDALPIPGQTAPKSHTLSHRHRTPHRRTLIIPIRTLTDTPQHTLTSAHSSAPQRTSRRLIGNGNRQFLQPVRRKRHRRPGMTPVTPLDLCRVPVEQLPHGGRLLAKAAVSAEHEGVENHACIRALVLVEQIFGLLPLLDRRLESPLVRVRLGAHDPQTAPGTCIGSS